MLGLGLGLHKKHTGLVIPNRLECLAWCDKTDTTELIDSLNDYDIIICDVGGSPVVDGSYFYVPYYANIKTVDTDDRLYTGTVPNILLYSDSTYDNKFFISASTGIIALYNSEQTEQNLANVVKKLDLYEYAVDSDDVRAVDSEGYYAIAPKTTTMVY